MAHRDTRRCYSCGRRLLDDDPDDDRPARRPERMRPRRDCEPHRGGLILTFGIIACATLFVCWPLAPVALIFGILAWVMGGGDLRKINAGTMDPEGHGITQAGWICGIVGTALNGLAVLTCGGFIAFAIISDTQQQRNQPKFRNPPVAPRKF